MKKLFPDMKFSAVNRRNQMGVSIVDALGAMTLAGMIAAGTMGALASNIVVTDVQRDASTAVSIANATVQKTNPIQWNKVGFLSSDVSITNENHTTASGNTYKTVVLEDGVTQDIVLKPQSIVVDSGQEYVVNTAIYWEHEPVGGPNASGYGVKHIDVTVRWSDRKGDPHKMTVGSTRTPNIGEAIPSGLSEYKEYTPDPSETTTPAPEPTTDPMPEPTATTEPTPVPTTEPAPTTEPEPAPTTEPSPEPAPTTEPAPQVPGDGGTIGEPETTETAPAPAPTEGDGTEGGVVEVTP